MKPQIFPNDEEPEEEEYRKRKLRPKPPRNAPAANQPTQVAEGSDRVLRPRVKAIPKNKLSEGQPNASLLPAVNDPPHFARGSAPSLQPPPAKRRVPDEKEERLFMTDEVLPGFTIGKLHPTLLNGFLKRTKGKQEREEEEPATSSANLHTPPASSSTPSPLTAIVESPSPAVEAPPALTPSPEPEVDLPPKLSPAHSPVNNNLLPAYLRFSREERTLCLKDLRKTPTKPDSEYESSDSGQEDSSPNRIEPKADVNQQITTRQSLCNAHHAPEDNISLKKNAPNMNPRRGSPPPRLEAVVDISEPLIELEKEVIPCQSLRKFVDKSAPTVANKEPFKSKPVEAAPSPPRIQHITDVQKPEKTADNAPSSLSFPLSQTRPAETLNLPPAIVNAVERPTRPQLEPAEEQKRAAAAHLRERRRNGSPPPAVRIFIERDPTAVANYLKQQKKGPHPDPLGNFSCEPGPRTFRFPSPPKQPVETVKLDVKKKKTFEERRNKKTTYNQLSAWSSDEAEIIPVKKPLLEQNKQVATRQRQHLRNDPSAPTVPDGKSATADPSPNIANLRSRTFPADLPFHCEAGPNTSTPLPSSSKGPVENVTPPPAAEKKKVPTKRQKKEKHVNNRERSSASPSSSSDEDSTLLRQRDEIARAKPPKVSGLSKEQAACEFREAIRQIKEVYPALLRANQKAAQDEFALELKAMQKKRLGLPKGILPNGVRPNPPPAWWSQPGVKTTTIETTPSMPKMNFYHHTERSFKGEEYLSLSHIPYIADDYDSEALVQDLEELYPEGIHGTKKGWGVHISEYLLYKLMKKLMFAWHSSGKQLITFYHAIYTVFPNKYPPSKLKNIWPQLVLRFEGKEAVLSIERIMLSSEDAIRRCLCIKCGMYGCLIHGVVEKPPKMHRQKVFHPVQHRPCGNNCYLYFPEIEVGYSSDELDEDCPIKKRTDLVVELKPFTQADVQSLFKRLANINKNTPCQLANMVGRMEHRTCQEIYLLLKDLEETDVESSPERRKNPLSIYASNFHGKTDVREVIFHCAHEGDCSKDRKDCPCAHSTIGCYKYCKCKVDCKLKYTGCRCPPGRCNSVHCPCVYAMRECDPELCTSCNSGTQFVHPRPPARTKPDQPAEPKTENPAEPRPEPPADTYLEQNDDTPRKEKEKDLLRCNNVQLQRGACKKVAVGRSNIAGNGLFMAEAAKKGDCIGEYVGEIITEDEANRRGRTYDAKRLSYTFDLNRSYVIDATRAGNATRFINHSTKNPNCEARFLLVDAEHRIGIYARRDLEKGEELFFDYRYEGEAKKYCSLELDDNNKMKKK